MKTFIFIHHLVAESGHIITLVKANTEKEARNRYFQRNKHLWFLGLTVKEFTENIEEVFNYDNPAYEG